MLIPIPLPLPQVQDLKGSIRVFCRIRPSGRTGDQAASCTEEGEEGELAIHDVSGNLDCKIFRFDKIFGGASDQASVYEDTQPLIRSVLDGRTESGVGESQQITRDLI